MSHTTCTVLPHNVWDRPRVLEQHTLFPLPADEWLAHARVSRDDLKRWRVSGWISFDVDSQHTLDVPECGEICFVRNIARAGLSNELVDHLLSELPKPYRYDPTRVAYSFAFGWVQAPALPQRADIELIIEENLDRWIDDLAMLGDGARLSTLQKKVEDALFAVVERAAAKRGEAEA